MLKNKYSTKKRILITISMCLLLLIASGAALGYVFFKPLKIEKTTYLYIDKNDTMDDVMAKIEKEVKLPLPFFFRLVMKISGYEKNIAPGRYEIKSRTSEFQLFRDLRWGNQKSLMLTFNNIRTKQELADRLCKQLQFNKESLLELLNDSTKYSRYGFDKENIISAFIPNSYDVWWTVTPDELLQRMIREYNIFWSSERREKAKSLGLDPKQVAILASIVEEECYYADEYPIVAGLYLNRLHKGINLQADPTVKFAVGDFSLRQILFSHLKIDSPYNTYLYNGLPPGPIKIPSIAAIDSVLNAQANDYLYMCAKDDFTARHRFAKTMKEHFINAQKYRNALRKRLKNNGIVSQRHR